MTTAKTDTTSRDKCDTKLQVFMGDDTSGKLVWAILPLSHKLKEHGVFEMRCERFKCSKFYSPDAACSPKRAAAQCEMQKHKS